MPSELSSVDNLFEDLHWLLLISAYLIADESDGETPLIPSEIISYSSSLKGQVDVQATFHTLCTSQNQNLGKCYCCRSFNCSINQSVRQAGRQSISKVIHSVS